MKKAISILIVLAAVLSVTSCAGKNKEEITEASVSPHAERETVTAERKPNESGVAASGDNTGIHWILYNDGELDITGAGRWDASEQVLAYAEMIKKVCFSEGISIVGQEAFKGCKNLKELSLPESMQIIEEQAFSGCNVQALNFGKNVASFSADAFDECEITDIKISADNAYYSTDRYGVIFNKAKTELVMYSDGFRMNSYTVPSTVERIGENAFLGNEKLVSIDFSDSLIQIGARAFADCENLREISLPQQITLIGESAFENCTSLKEVEFPETLQVIGDNSFAGCTEITQVSLPKSVTTVGTKAFADSVEKVYYAGSKTAWSAVWVGDKAFVNASIIFGEKDPKPE